MDAALVVCIWLLASGYFLWFIECSCLYEYNIQPANEHRCNPSICNCSLDLACSVITMNRSPNATIVWYYTNTHTNNTEYVTSDKEHIVKVKKSNYVIMSSLSVSTIKEEELFMYYWCEVKDPSYTAGSLAKSNVINVIKDTTLTNCTSDTYINLQYELNRTCADIIDSDSHPPSTDNGNSTGIRPLVISCVCTVVSIWLFLMVVVLYCRLHYKTRGKRKLIIERYYDVYGEPTEISEVECPTHADEQQYQHMKAAVSLDVVI